MKSTDPCNWVFHTRDRLLDRLGDYCGETLSGESFAEFVGEINRLLPGANSEAVYQTARSLAGSVMTPGEMKNFCWRLAGNLPALKRGEPIYPWQPSDPPEDAPAQVLDYWPTRTKMGRSAALFNIRIFAGRACPLVIKKTWQLNFVSFLARSVFGFSRSEGKKPYRHPSELVRLRLLVHLDPTLSRNNIPDFKNVSKFREGLKWNRKILEFRARKNFECPIQAEHFCFECPIGYDQCPASCRPRTLELGTCPRCQQDDYFDPRFDCGCCVSCARKQ